jgi:hypothetical protein
MRLLAIVVSNEGCGGLLGEILVVKWGANQRRQRFAVRRDPAAEASTLHRRQMISIGGGHVG